MAPCFCGFGTACLIYSKTWQTTSLRVIARRSLAHVRYVCAPLSTQILIRSASDVQIPWQWLFALFKYQNAFARGLLQGIYKLKSGPGYNKSTSHNSRSSCTIRIHCQADEFQSIVSHLRQIGPSHHNSYVSIWWQSIISSTESLQSVAQAIFFPQRCTAYFSQLDCPYSRNPLVLLLLASKFLTLSGNFGLSYFACQL